MQMPKGWQNMAQLAGKDEDDAEIKYEVEFRLPEGGAGIGSFRRLGLDIKYFQKKNLDTLCALCKRYGMSVEDQQKIGTGIDGKRDCISYLSDHFFSPARPPAEGSAAEEEAVERLMCQTADPLPFGPGHWQGDRPTSTEDLRVSPLTHQPEVLQYNPCADPPLSDKPRGSIVQPNYFTWDPYGITSSWRLHTQPSASCAGDTDG